MAGHEIVQCYVRDMVASMARPVKELKGFEKLFLQKGEEKEVEFHLTREELSFYNCKGEFVFEEGAFEIQVGRNCRDIEFRAIVEL